MQQTGVGGVVVVEERLIEKFIPASVIYAIDEGVIDAIFQSVRPVIGNRGRKIG